MPQSKGFSLEIDNREFVAGLTAAMHRKHIQGAKGLVLIGNRVIASAKRYVPEQTHRLHDALGVDGPYTDEHGSYVDVGVVKTGTQVGEAVVTKSAASRARAHVKATHKGG